MKFFSSLRLALHNLWNNKSRSVITIVIVFVVSTLIMALLLIGTNFLENMGRANTLSFELNGTSYRIDRKDQRYNSSSNQDYSSSTFKECLSILDKAKDYPFAVSTGFVMGQSSLIEKDEKESNNYYNYDGAFYNYNIPLAINDGKVIEGAQWQSSDEGKDGIWLNSEYVKQQVKKGKFYEIGQKLECFSYVREQYGNNQKQYYYERVFTVRGIILLDEDGRLNQHASGMMGFVSGDYALNEEQKSLGVGGDGLSIYYTPEKDTFNYNVVEKQLTAFTKDVNEMLGKGIDYQGNPTDRFVCSYLFESLMARLMGLAIMAVVIVLSFLILILSIGSVANTIIISVDKNKKFIGLMMAMGLNNRGVKKIVHKEAFVQILIGILLATIVIFLAQSIMVVLLDQMLGSMFMSLLQGTPFAIEFSMAFYVPIGTFIMFLLMALAFSKGALNKMGKADVISIISEVA